MIQEMLDGSYERVRLVHVPMRFSRSMGEMGRMGARKLLHLLTVIASIWLARIRCRAPVLYYPPAGPSRVAMWRDIVILLTTRWIFRRTIFHFHAAGLMDLYPKLLPIERLFFRLAYFRPDVAIKTGPSAPNAPGLLQAKHRITVFYGAEDVSGAFPQGPRAGFPRVLYVGLIGPSKGVMVLLEAAARLASDHQDFVTDLVGEFESDGFEHELRRYVDEHLPGKVVFHGVLVNDEKYARFASADVFCFPSFFHAESSPVVLIEAMCFGLPLVASDWRGIRDLVRHGENGFLVPVRDSSALAEEIGHLLSEPDLRKRFGRRSREIYEEGFTLADFRARMQQVFDAAISDL